MKFVKLPGENLTKFIESLRRYGEIYAPQKKGASGDYAFEPLESPDKVGLDYQRTILPLKKFFFRPTDTLFRFSEDAGYVAPDESEARPGVIFGAHACDIYALNILDLVFSGKYPDAYYLNRRENTPIIGLSCVPDDKCFCSSMDAEYVEDGFDLFLNRLDVNRLDSCFLVRVATSRGDDMVNAAKELFGEIDREVIKEYKQKTNEKASRFTRKVDLSDLPELISLEYRSGLWEELGQKCLSCGTCSMVCPTCYCYNVYDLLNLDAASGERVRQWASCLFADHALVAGGHSFRKERSARVRQRYLHKQEGFVDQYGRPSCVGCGRCIKYCPAGIDICEVINRIRGEQSAEHSA